MKRSWIFKLKKVIIKMAKKIKGKIKNKENEK